MSNLPGGELTPQVLAAPTPKQRRLWSLLIFLWEHKEVTSHAFLEHLQCSKATLTRTLSEAKSTYALDVHFKKSTLSFEMLSPGRLTDEFVQQITQALQGAVPRKKRLSLVRRTQHHVTLSLPVRLLRQLDAYAEQQALTRSQAAAILIQAALPAQPS